MKLTGIRVTVLDNGLLVEANYNEGISVVKYAYPIKKSALEAIERLLSEERSIQ